MDQEKQIKQKKRKISEVINSFDMEELNAYASKQLPYFLKMHDDFGYMVACLHNFINLAQIIKYNNYKKSFTTQEILFYTISCFDMLHPTLGKRAKNIIQNKNFQSILFPVINEKRKYNLIKEKINLSLSNKKQIKFLKKKNLTHMQPGVCAIGKFPKKNCVIVFKQQPILILAPTNTLRGLITPSHEMMHACSTYGLAPKYFLKDILVTEIESIFAEKVMTDYLYQNNIISLKEKYEINNMRNFAFFTNTSNAIAEMGAMKIVISAMEKGNIKKEDLIKMGNNLLKTFGESLDSINLMKGRNYEYNFRYVIGHIVADTMYRKFKKDPKFIDWYVDTYLNNLDKLSLKEAVVLCEKQSKNIKEIKRMSEQELNNNFKRAFANMTYRAMKYTELETKKLQKNKVSKSEIISVQNYNAE